MPVPVIFHFVTRLVTVKKKITFSVLRHSIREKYKQCCMCQNRVHTTTNIQWERDTPLA